MAMTSTRSALGGAFLAATMAAAPASPARAQSIERFFDRIPDLIERSPIARALGIKTVEECAADALVRRHGEDAPIARSEIPEVDGGRRIVQTRLSVFGEGDEFRTGSMVIIDRRRSGGPGTLTVVAAKLEKDDLGLDLDTVPAGRGSYTRVRLDKDDISAKGRFNDFAGPLAETADVESGRRSAFRMVDTLRRCLAPLNP